MSCLLQHSELSLFPTQGLQYSKKLYLKSTKLLPFGQTIARLSREVSGTNQRNLDHKPKPEKTNE